MSASAKEGGRLPFMKKAGFAAAVFFMFLAGLEVVFRLAGLFAPESIFTVFQADGGGMVRYEWSAGKPEFRPTPAPGTFRIMLAGGSTALGFPYHPRSSIGLRLGALIEDSLPGKKVEVINLGRMGINAGEVERVVHAALDFHPDLVIVYTGQNEFISLLRSSPFLRVVEGMSAPEGIGRLRVARALMSAAGLVAAGVAMGVMRSFDEHPEALELPPPTPLSPSMYKQALLDYRHALEGMISDCRSRKVPVIVSTMASNLRDWPPDFRSLPAGMSAETSQQAVQSIYEAREFEKEGKPGQALELLGTLVKQYPDYAPIPFEIGRVKTAMFQQGMLEREGPPADPARLEKMRVEALADFKNALALEDRVIMSNRAPPELNEVVRQTAKESGAWLFDASAFVEESLLLAPGFDFFEDHCHPNLWGQQVMAEALLEMLADHGLPAPAAEWAEPSPRDEKAFEAAQGMDSKFMHDLNIRIAVFLGLEKDLPDGSAATRQKFQDAVEQDPTAPLPVVLEALVDAYYGDAAHAASLLAPLYKERPQDFDKCLARYLAAAEVRQGIFMAGFSRSPGNPPLRGLLKSGLFTEDEDAAGEARALASLSRFSFFLDLERGGADITARMERELRTREDAKRRGGQRPLVIMDAGKGVTLAAGPGARLIRVGAAAEYEMSVSSYLTTGPVGIGPAQFEALELRGVAGASDQGILVLWSWVDADGRAMISGDYARPAEGGGYTLDLSVLPRWVLAREVQEIRIMPGREGEFSLAGMELLRLGKSE